MFNLPNSYDGLTISKAPQSAYSYILAQLKNSIKKPIIYVAINEVSAKEIYQSLKIILSKNTNIYFFPSWDVLPYDRVSPNSEVISNRLNILYELVTAQEKHKDIILITTINSFLTKVIPKQIFSKSHLKLQVGTERKQQEISEFLISNSYLRVDTVNSAGEFSIKGSLFDIFPLGYEMPVRLDFFADKIEFIKEFDPITQITNKKITEIILLPASEVILADQYIENFKRNYRNLFDIDYQDDMLYEAISAKRQYIGMEHWLPLFYDKLDKISDYLDQPVIIFDGLFHNAVKERIAAIEDYYQARKSFAKIRTAETYNPIKPELLYLNNQEITELLEHHEIITIDNFSKETGYVIESRISTIPDFYAQSKLSKIAAIELFKEFIQNCQHKNIIITAHNEISLKRLVDILANYELESKIIEIIPQKKQPIILLIKLPLTRGFIAKDTVFVSEQDLFGSKIIRKESKKRKAEKLILEAGSLSIGEYIVHKEHGIGRFIGLKILNVGGSDHDFINLEYHDGDKLYIPVENLDLISRYGTNHGEVRLDKLGSASFQRRKAGLKKRILEIATDLIATASARELKKGLTFSATEELLQEFSSLFKFDETEDQLSAIDDVLTDLKQGKIMDRLICGDVGFGKTEIAMRAAFAVLYAHTVSQKPQIAIIVPTTLLARQHYKNFTERFASFNCNIKQLSRMVTVSEAKKVKLGLADGSVDIVIGTHALLNKNIEFKNLSLAIIDEEQHFGVVQKERIKSLKNNVNLLTLSATPIPRTLQMSLNGIKDMSLLATPPVDRMAVKSFIMPFDKLVIRDAILREYYRGGRVFYVCPRISDLVRQEEKIRKLVPEIKIVTAHGAMKPDKLDQIMNDFCDGKYDLLLSTSIIESGIDIAEANTIIIHDADKFGLSQLYQLRGRVGRSKIRAYAYFTFSDKKLLNEVAKKRLEVMQKLDGLGAGFSLASYDLDIRGAGNLLGQAQSGHIKEVGAELYQDMLNEAITKLKAQQDQEKIIQEEDFSPQVNLGLLVLIPENYVKDINVKMDLYRRIAFLQDNKEADELLFEMEDRFGTIPDSVKNLVEIINLKNKCKKAYIEKFDVGPKGMLISFYKNNFPNPDKLMNFILSNSNYYKLRPDQKLVVSIPSNEQDRIKKTAQILEQILELR